MAAAHWRPHPHHPHFTHLSCPTALSITLPYPLPLSQPKDWSAPCLTQLRLRQIYHTMHNIYTPLPTYVYHPHATPTSWPHPPAQPHLLIGPTPLENLHPTYTHRSCIDIRLFIPWGILAHVVSVCVSMCQPCCVCSVRSCVMLVILLLSIATVQAPHGCPTRPADSGKGQTGEPPGSAVHRDCTTNP